jgi:hypothetical protein
VPSWEFRNRISGNKEVQIMDRNVGRAGESEAQTGCLLRII